MAESVEDESDDSYNTTTSSSEVAAHKVEQGCFSVLVSSIGLATDFYDFGVVNNVKAMLQDEFGAMTVLQKATLSASAIIGAVLGQVCIGMLADRFGRRAMFITCSTLTFAGALLSALAWDPGNQGIYWMLIAFRMLMGFGIGGEYPCCASHMAESSQSGNSGRNIALGVAAMGMGGVLAPALVASCLAAGLPYHITWRLAFGFGAAVSLLSLVLRVMSVKNSSQFEGVQARQSFRKSFRLLWDKYRLPLFGTAGAWFWYDLVDYGLGLYSAQISGVATGSGILGETVNTLFFALIALPGAYGAAWFLPFVGRKRTFLYGYVGMIAIFIALVFFFEVLPGWLFTVLYGLQLTFDWMGPCAASYVVPSEIFPTAARATAHGISAACGKLGAVVGIYGVGVLVSTIGVRWMLLVVGLLTCVAMLWVHCLIPHYDEGTLERLEEVDRRGDPHEITSWLYGGGVRSTRDCN